ncbi:hypothetical protein K7G98_35205, partial [Saccharothrix sp. MB29]|nr:hypothetical protein [Saccharothrix sp. MB29]
PAKCNILNSSTTAPKIDPILSLNQKSVNQFHILDANELHPTSANACQLQRSAANQAEPQSASMVRPFP